jgi:competence protein ComEC
MTTPLFPVTILFCLGIWMGLKLEIPGHMIGWSNLFLWSNLVYFRWKNQYREFIYGICLQFFCLGLMTAKLVPPHTPDDLPQLLAQGRLDLSQPCRIQGRCCRNILQGDVGEQFTIDVDQIENRSSIFRTHGKIRVASYYSKYSQNPVNSNFSEELPVRSPSLLHATLPAATVATSPSDKPAISAGDYVEIFLLLRTPLNFRNPGGLDAVDYLHRQDIYLIGTFKDPALITVLPNHSTARYLMLINRIRDHFARQIDALFPSETNSRTTLRALLLGEKNGLPSSIEHDFQETSTYHILVVSGQHVVILSFFLAVLLRFFRAPPLIQFLLIGIVLILYSEIAERQPSIVRASVMCGCFLLTRIWDRDPNGLNALSLSAMGLLSWDPRWISDAGFQLSFLAVLAILVVGRPLLSGCTAPLRSALRHLDNEDLDVHLSPLMADFRVYLRFQTQKIGARIGRRGAKGILALFQGISWFLISMLDIFLIAIAVQVLFLPLMAYYFNRVVPLAPFFNFIAVPLVSLLLPLGFAILLLSMGIPGLTGWLAPILAYPVHGWLCIIHFFATHAWLNVRVADLPGWLYGGYFTALAGYFLLRQKILRRMMAIFAVGCLLLFLVRPFQPFVHQHQMEFTMLDVHQGDSIFIQCPDSATLLVDGGGIPGSFPAADHLENPFDIGEKVVAPYLWSRRLEHIDAIMATHEHHDHLSGLFFILRTFHPHEVWTANNPASPIMTQFLKEALRQGVRWRPISRGDSFDFHGLEMECLNPENERSGRDNSPDDSCLVIRARYHQRSVLLTGDISARIEKAIQNFTQNHAASPIQLNSDVLKISHHGSRTASSDEFLKHIHPAVALISAYRYNPFNHPHPDTLKKLTQRQIMTLRTDLHGAITLISNGRNISISTFADY